MMPSPAVATPYAPSHLSVPPDMLPPSTLPRGKSVSSPDLGAVKSTTPYGRQNTEIPALGATITELSPAEESRSSIPEQHNASRVDVRGSPAPGRTAQRAAEAPAPPKASRWDDIRASPLFKKTTANLSYQPDIRVFLASNAATSKPNNTPPLEILRGGAIVSIKLRLKADLTHRGWYSTPRRLVFGDRDLNDNVEEEWPMLHGPGQGPNSSQSYDSKSTMHLLLKLSDIEFVVVKALEVNEENKVVEREFCVPLRSKQNVKNLLDEIKRADLLEPSEQRLLTLTDSEESGQDSSQEKQLSLYFDGQVVPDTASLKDLGVQANTVMHLLVQKSAKMNVKPVSLDTVDVIVDTGHDRADTERKLQRDEALWRPYRRPKKESSYSVNKAKEPKSLASRASSMRGFLMVDGGPGSPQSTPTDHVDSWTPDASASLDEEMIHTIEDAQKGLAAGVAPELTEAGTGGTYFLSNSYGSKVAVFKPEDEEPLAANNPRGYNESATGEGMRKGTRVGEGAKREVAAYLLDHGHFAGVPSTTFAHLSGESKHKERPSEDEANLPVEAPTTPLAGAGGSSTEGEGDPPAWSPEFVPKRGALQQFIRCESDAEEMGPSAFDLHEVHKITVLDIRLANTDRNGGNILVHEVKNEEESGGEAQGEGRPSRSAAKHKYKLIPIDHGYTLPHSLQDISFEWEFWPQARIPYGPEIREYIANLDAEADLIILQSQGIELPQDCQRVFRVCTMLLQKAAAMEITPEKIAAAMTRRMWNQMSDLEKMSARASKVACAHQSVERPSSGKRHEPHTPEELKRYLQEMSRLLDEYLDGVKEEAEWEGIGFH